MSNFYHYQVPQRPYDVICYRGDVYRRLPTHYELVELAEFSLMVTRYLATQGLGRLTKSHVENVVNSIKAITRLEGTQPLPFYAELDGNACPQERKYLAFSNGIINLEELRHRNELTLMEHTPNWVSTTVLPYQYDPRARVPRWLDFLIQTFPRQGSRDNRIRLLQEWFGYNLLAGAPFQHFMMLQGAGANGKTVVLEILRCMLGRENTSQATLEQLGTKFGLQGLLGKVANICGDFSDTSKLDEGRLKELTGGEPVCVGRKYLLDTTLNSGIKFTFACNALPIFNDRTGGLWRRLILLPFLNVVPQRSRNPELVNELIQELPGILNWSIRGLRRLLRRGRFIRCRLCEDAKNEHRLACNPVEQFLNETLPQLHATQLVRCGSSDLYLRYESWSRRHGYKPLSHRKFTPEVRTHPDFVRAWPYCGVVHFEFRRCATHREHEN